MRNKGERIQEHSLHEKEVWGEVFKKELEINNPKKFSSYWWEYYYEQISQAITDILSTRQNPTILEAGSGSGKATLLSFPHNQITLLDITPEGLTLAKQLAKSYGATQVTYIEGNMFFMPFQDGAFDLVWNIGVVEHYEKDLVIELLREMLRVTNKNGYIAIAVPNFKSLPVKKAMLLARSKFKRWLRFMNGYRLDTEKHYSAQDMKKILEEVAREERIELEEMKILYLGSSLVIGAPRFLVKFFSKLEHLFSERKFLVLTLAKKIIR